MLLCFVQIVRSGLIRSKNLSRPNLMILMTNMGLMMNTICEIFLTKMVSTNTGYSPALIHPPRWS